MAGKGTIGAKLVLEGESQYKSALKNIASAQKELKSEMALCSAEFKSNQNSIDALTAKYAVLQKQYDAQAEKVKVYSDALSEAESYQTKAQESVDLYTEQLAKEQQALDELKASETATNEQIEEQQKKVDEVAQALEKANVQYDAAGQKVSQYQTNLNYAQAGLADLDAELQRTGQFLEEAKNSTDGTATSIDNLGREVKETESEASTFGEVLKANLASEAIIAGVEKVVGLIKEAGEELFQAGLNAAFYADNINTMSTNTGIATDTLQELTYAQELMDVSVDTVTSAITRNTRSMASAQQGSKEYANAYRELGVAVTDSNGNLRNSEEVFWDMVDALGKVDNAAERDALAMKLLGRNAQSLNGLIKIGSAGFRSLANEAHEAGYVMSGETLNNLTAVSDAWERMQNRITTVKNSIGAKIAPALEKSFTKISAAIEKNEGVFEELANSIIPALADGLAWLIDNAQTLLPIMTAIGAGFIAQKTIVPLATACIELFTVAEEGATVAQEGLNVAMNANPVGILIVGMTALTAALSAYMASADFSTKRTKEFNDAHSSLADSMANARKEYAENANKLNEQGLAAGALFNKLKSLKESYGGLEKGSAAANSNIEKQSAIMAQLNEMYPELNLSINRSTGEWNKQTDAIEKNIKAFIQQAKQAGITKRVQDIELSKAQFDTKYGAEQVAEWKKQGAELTKARDDAYNAYRNQINEFLDQGYSLKTAQHDAEYLKSAWLEASSALANWEHSTGYLIEEREALDREEEGLIGTLTDSTKATKDAANAAEKAAGASSNLGEGFANASAQAKEYALNVAEAAESAVKSFDEIQIGATRTDMTKVLKSNTEKTKEWADGLEELAKKGLDAGTMQQLMDEGVTSLDKVRGFLKMSEEGIKDYNQAVKDSETTIEGVKDSIANAYDGAGAIEFDAEGTANNAKAAGEAGAQGLAEGVESGKGDVKNAATEATDEAGKAAAKEGETKGKEAGKKTTESQATGMKESKGQTDKAAEEIANSIISTFNKKLSGGGNEMVKVGLNAMKALATGIKKGKSEVSKAVNEVLSSVKSAQPTTGDGGKTTTKSASVNASEFVASSIDELSNDAANVSMMEGLSSSLENGFNAMSDAIRANKTIVEVSPNSEGIFTLTRRQAMDNYAATGRTGLEGV